MLREKIAKALDEAHESGRREQRKRDIKIIDDTDGQDFPQERIIAKKRSLLFCVVISFNSLQRVRVPLRRRKRERERIYISFSLCSLFQ